MSGLDLKARLRVAAAIDGAMLAVSGRGADELRREIERVEREAEIASKALDEAKAEKLQLVRAGWQLLLVGLVVGAVCGAYLEALFRIMLS